VPAPQLLDVNIHPSQFLVSLSLAKCNLGESGGLVISGALKTGNLKLRILNLAHNALRDKAAAAFGEVLEAGHTLRELDLGWNQIQVGQECQAGRGLPVHHAL
jgi:hypothetical protein